MGLYLHIQQLGQVLSFGLPHAVPSVGDEHHRHLVFPLAVHQAPEALLGRGDQRPAPNQHPIDVEKEPEGAATLRRPLGHRELIINFSRYYSTAHYLISDTGNRVRLCSHSASITRRTRFIGGDK